jgi:hypothetical protein
MSGACEQLRSSSARRVKGEGDDQPTTGPARASRTGPISTVELLTCGIPHLGDCQRRPVADQWSAVLLRDGEIQNESRSGNRCQHFDLDLVV